MVKISKDIAHKLRNQGKTFTEIGRMFDVSRQYVASMYSGYAKRYARTEKHKMYKRHYKGHSNPYKPCEHCNPNATSISATSSTI